MLVETMLKMYIETKFNTDVIGVNVKLEEERFKSVTITLIDKRNCAVRSCFYFLSYLNTLDTLSFDTIIEDLYLKLAKSHQQSS